jgi:hypothetical protein
MWVCNVGELSLRKKENEIGVLAQILIFHSRGVAGMSSVNGERVGNGYPCVQTLLAMQRISPCRKGLYTLSRLFTTVCTLWKSSLEAVWRIRDVYLGSRILIFTHPGSRISDPGSRIQKQQQKREVKKKISCHTFLCTVATNFTKL